MPCISQFFGIAIYMYFNDHLPPHFHAEYGGNEAMMSLEQLVRIQAVEVLQGFHVRLEFTDGTHKQVDLEPYLRGPVFEPIRNDPVMFRSVKVDQRMGTIVWDNGADVDPDVLYYDLRPAWMEAEQELAELKAA